MKKRLLPLFLLSTTTCANEPVTTFINGAYLSTEQGSQYSIGLHHYFAPQTSNGVYDEFGYLDTDSSIAISYDKRSSDFSSSNYVVVSVELFLGNYIISASHASSDYKYETSEQSGSGSDTASSFGLGYLFSDNLIIKADLYDYSDKIEIGAQYSHELNSNGDYVGFSLNVSDDFNYKTVSADYFGQLSNGRYIRVGISHQESDGYGVTSYSTSYYLSEGMSISLQTDFDNRYNYSAKYYFTKSMAVEAQINTSVDSSEDTMIIGLSGQF
jgi:hypothetical protein